VSAIKSVHGNELFALDVGDKVVVYNIIEPSTVHLLGVTPSPE